MKIPVNGFLSASLKIAIQLLKVYVHEEFVEAFYQSYRNKAPSVKTVQRAVHHELQVPGHTYVEPEVGSHQTEQFVDDMMHIDADRIIDLDGMIQNAEQFNATWLAP